VGTQLARQVEVLAMAGRLDDISNTSRYVLLLMALNAHDTGTKDTPEACYFRGWEHLASCMGHRGLTAGGRSAVYRALTELRDAKLVDVDEWPNRGHRHQVYRLTLL
jgi:hypothetical protein